MSGCLGLPRLAPFGAQKLRSCPDPPRKGTLMWTRPSQACAAVLPTRRRNWRSFCDGASSLLYSKISQLPPPTHPTHGDWQQGHFPMEQGDVLHWKTSPLLPPHSHEQGKKQGGGRVSGNGVRYLPCCPHSLGLIRMGEPAERQIWGLIVPNPAAQGPLSSGSLHLAFDF